MPTKDRPAPTNLLPKTRELTATWGFTEDAALRALHRQLVDTIRTGKSAQELWIAYLDAAEPQVNFPQDGRRTAKARSALSIARAQIWIEAGEAVDAIIELLAAETAARDLGWGAEEALLTTEIARHGSDAEYHQAKAGFFKDVPPHFIFEDTEPPTAASEYEAAIELYRQGTEDPALSATHLGHINRRLAECYLALLHLEAERSEDLQPLIIASLATAADLLQGSPELAKVEGLIERLSQDEPWWDEALAALEQ